MSEEFKEDYSNFFKRMKEFKEKQTKQKERGLNDYNLLTTVLSANDEVRLHSKMIHSLLDPDGSHYQGSLFLESFLDVIGFKDEGFDIDKVIVKREYENIDLYITDGEHHIIIENKINAGDQESQIKRYVEIIVEKLKKNGGNTKNITVIYLSIARSEPSKYSLGELDSNRNNEYFIIKNKKLYYRGDSEPLKGCITKFKSIHYNKHILDWLGECQHEIQNITNLNEAIKQYIEVVKVISGEDTSKSKQIKDFLGESTGRMKTAADIYESQMHNYDDNENKELIEDVGNNFLKTLDEKYKNIGMIIGQALIEKLKMSSKIKEVIPFILSTPQKQYANHHYLDLILENGIRVQLQYKNYFKLSSINVYQGNFHKEIKSQRNGININFEFDDFYELLTNEDYIIEMSKNHVENIELIKELKEAIEYGSNIKSLSCSDN